MKVWKWWILVTERVMNISPLLKYVKFSAGFHNAQAMKWLFRLVTEMLIYTITENRSYICNKVSTIIFVLNYTGFPFQRVRLQRAPFYNKQIPLHYTHWQQCQKVWLRMQLPTMSSFLCIFLHVLRGALCKEDFLETFRFENSLAEKVSVRCNIWWCLLDLFVSLVPKPITSQVNVISWEKLEKR